MYILSRLLYIYHVCLLFCRNVCSMGCLIKLYIFDKLYHIMLYQAHLACAGFDLTTLVVIGTDCIEHIFHWNWNSEWFNGTNKVCKFFHRYYTISCGCREKKGRHGKFMFLIWLQLSLQKTPYLSSKEVWVWVYCV
jgi:hypothetical protein